MSIRAIVFGILLTAASTHSYAAVQYLTSTVKFVYPMSDGSFVLGFTNDAPTCTNVNTPKYFYVTPGQNGVTADGAKAMLSTALTAFAIGTTMSIAFDDATVYCYINRFSIQ